jgi:hypothetical protein
MPTNIYNMVDTWNASGTTFYAIKMDVTNTASAAGSLLLDLQVAGISKFKVDKNGITTPIAINWNNDVGLTRSGTGVLEVNNATPGTLAALRVATLRRSAPITITAATYTVIDSDSYIICNRGSTTTITLPAAASYVGREITIKTIQAFTVVSASSNVIPRTGPATAAAAILSGTNGAWAKLVSDGSNWIVMQAA